MSGPTVASTVLLLFGLAVVSWIHTRHYLSIIVDPVRIGVPGPLISVCIPARNEAHTIAACVEAIFAQTYPQLEMIVIDDQSTDATPRILANLHSTFPSLIVVEGAPLPPGWA